MPTKTSPTLASQQGDKTSREILVRLERQEMVSMDDAKQLHRCGGLGIGLQDDPSGFHRLVHIAPGSAASLSKKLSPGDIVTAIDGQSTHGKKTSEVVEMIRGLPGTPVFVTIHRTPTSLFVNGDFPYEYIEEQGARSVTVQKTDHDVEEKFLGIAAFLDCVREVAQVDSELANEENSVSSPGNPSRNSSAEFSMSSSGNQEDFEKLIEAEYMQELFQKETSLSGGFWSKGETIPSMSRTRPIQSRPMDLNELDIDLQIDTESPTSGLPKVHDDAGASYSTQASSHCSRSTMASMDEILSAERNKATQRIDDAFRDLPNSSLPGPGLGTSVAKSSSLIQGNGDDIRCREFSSLQGELFSRVEGSDPEASTLASLSRIDELDLFKIKFEGLQVFGDDRMIAPSPAAPSVREVHGLAADGPAGQRDHEDPFNDEENDESHAEPFVRADRTEQRYYAGADHVRANSAQEARARQEASTPSTLLGFLWPEIEVSRGERVFLY
ncbi:hypothetical protein GUITHDRAFT_121516 [Guillardia theta CCMP2712]|uniref:PDZ domain-containing protein n=1 Tax=Guillardia theta (strain CCMP2712) TaxID=905079 RepID=L1I8D6_GUITC|nr:hypothetical protein GUITHDRAFT_121516 [Guillardia theta CCMP2712]EKX32322.1 hypothetical protein GUITHDRAFT_121516 [Guillardia theta CCMP2712]|eukprot:XP_005819302.1 hypothetical protein GUITHDRAFT_121516 [Guillardia theta CCMP2712]